MRLKGFTLAEVLITLGVIGVVAAMTMPALVQKSKEKETVTKLKKAYSVLSNAYMLAKAENGSGIDTWVEGKTGNEATQTLFENMKPYLNISKDCGFNGGCFKDVSITRLDGTPDTPEFNYGKPRGIFSTFILTDGTPVLLQGVPDTNTGIAVVDTGSMHGTSAYGKNIFFFRFYPDKVVPSGLPTESSHELKDLECTGNEQQDGKGCTAWVLLNENMEYLHCNDLSWNNKTQCK